MALTAEQVDSAIQTILDSGQSVTIGDTRYDRANLAELLKLRDKVQGEAAVSSGGSLIARAFFGVPRRS